jgi:outer membrane biosynthesis protein TonB
MRFGLPISLLAHSLFIAGGIFMFGRAIPTLDEGQIVAVEILTLAEITNVRAAIKRPDTKIPLPAPDEPPEPMQLETPMENAKTESEQVEKRQEDAAKPKTQPEPEPIKTAEAPVPEEVIEPPPEPPEKPAFDLDSLSDFVNKTRDAAPEKNQQVALQSEKNIYEFAEVSRTASGEGTGLSVSLLDKLQTEMLRCWRESRDAVDPETLVVQFRIRLLPDGYVEKVELLGETGSGPYAKVARQRAAAAIKKCEPYDFLPAENYSGWRDMTLSFRPRA